MLAFLRSIDSFAVLTNQAFLHLYPISTKLNDDFVTMEVYRCEHGSFSQCAISYERHHVGSQF